MEYPGRNRDESQFAERLSALSSAERRELRDLMGWPPSAARVPPSFWQEAEERRHQEAYLVLYLIFLSSADFHADELGADDAESDADPLGRDVDERLDAAAAQYADEAAGRLARQYRERAEAAFGRLSSRLMASPNAAEAMTNAEFEDELISIVGPDRDAQAAATWTTGAQTAGGDAAMIEIDGADVRQYDTWVNQPHLTKSGPCERCEALHDKPRMAWPYIDEHAADGPPLHDYCILPGQLATPLGVLTGAAESFYDGPCIEITLADGRRLAVTENHPILTPTGWLAAKLLRKGGHVIGSRDVQRLASLANPNGDDRPTAIEEIFRAAKMVPAMITARVPLPPEALHGDARFVNGKVDIVAVDGQLRRYLQAASAKHIEQEPFALPDAAKRFLARLGAINNLCVACATSLASRMGGDDLIGSLRFAHASPNEGRGFAAAARRDAGGDQPLPKRIARDSQFGGQVNLGFAGDVTRQRGVKPWDRLAAGSHRPAPLHDGVEVARFNAKLAAQFMHRFAGHVTPREVVQIRQFGYAGHVYDLQVPSYRLFDTMGIVTSNCACVIAYTAPLPARA